MIDRCYIEITNTCNLNCDFCPKHHRRKRQLSAGEFNLLTDRVRGKVSFLYFHLMGEPLLHPLLPQFIRTANEKGFKTVLTSNGTLLHRCLPLLEALPHKIQLSLHSHESNARGELAGYMQEVMQFSVLAAEKGTCMVLRLWNQGGRDKENEEVMRLIEQYVPKPWKERPDGFRLSDHLYLEFDRKFEWPTAGEKSEENLKDESEKESGDESEKNLKNESEENLKEESEKESENGLGEKSSKKEKKQLFCKALIKQIGVLSDGSLVPCCLDHDGDVVLGNLLHQSLEEILASPRAQALIEGFMHHTASEKLCQNCESALAGNSFRGKARSSEK